MPDSLGYSVVVSVEIAQDPRAFTRLKERMRAQLDINAYNAEYVHSDPEDSVESWTTEKPSRAYNEDGEYIGDFFRLTVEIPVWR